jgi:hypothetical protein
MTLQRTPCVKHLLCCGAFTLKEGRERDNVRQSHDVIVLTVWPSSSFVSHLCVLTISSNSVLKAPDKLSAHVVDFIQTHWACLYVEK